MASLPDRKNEAYILESYGARKDGYQQWHDRTRDIDALIRGDDKMVVNNLADQMPRDVARLANEVQPTYRAPELGEGREYQRAAKVRSGIGEGYFEINRFDLVRPVLVMDLLRAGTGFLVHWTSRDSAFPKLMRVDPVNAFPDVMEGQIQDLLVETTVKARIADRKWPNLRIRAAFGEGWVEDANVEIVDYYSATGCWKAVNVPGGGVPTIVSRYDMEGITLTPVAFGFLPAPDGAFRGLVDQIAPGLRAKDKVVKDVMEYLHEMVYAPFEQKGIMNGDTPPGPDVIYQHDPTATTETFIRRVPPASSNGQIFQVVDFLSNEQRGQIAYPETRQGQVPVSQGSGQFINATQGQLTSLVREVQRVVTVMQEDSARIMYELDRNKLNFQKPLWRHVGKKKVYTPSADIDDTRLEVTLGFGSGLDAINATVQHLQLYSTGVYPARELLAQMPWITDPEGAIAERQQEELDRVLLQRFAGDPTTNIEFMAAIAESMDVKGMTFRAAYIDAVKAGISPTTPQPGTQTGMPTPAGAVAGEPGAEAEALQRGATTAPAIPGEFTPPPLQQVFVK